MEEGNRDRKYQKAFITMMAAKTVKKELLNDDIKVRYARLIYLRMLSKTKLRAARTRLD